MSHNKSGLLVSVRHPAVPPSSSARESTTAAFYLGFLYYEISTIDYIPR
jgi:hypothetical protein